MAFTPVKRVAGYAAGPRVNKAAIVVTDGKKIVLNVRALKLVNTDGAVAGSKTVVNAGVEKVVDFQTIPVWVYIDKDEDALAIHVAPDGDHTMVVTAHCATIKTNLHKEMIPVEGGDPVPFIGAGKFKIPVVLNSEGMLQGSMAEAKEVPKRAPNKSKTDAAPAAKAPAKPKAPAKKK